MIFGVYSIRDVKTGFMSPTIEPNDDAAARNFYHAVSTSDGILFTYASDFALYHLADFDSDTGVFTSLSPILQIADGAQALSILKKEAAKDAR